MTLTELAVVMAVVALLAVLSVPAVRALMGSFESGSSTRAMIGAALASARAMAAKEQSYVGVRFQKAYHPQGPLRASQYMIFIIHDKKATKLAYGFRAIAGLKPMKLPDSVGVTDMTTVYREESGNQVDITEYDVIDDTMISEERDVTDATTFSIVFSPSGKLLIHEVRVRNCDGFVDSSSGIGDVSGDDVFNKIEQVNDGLGLFYQDDYFLASWSPYPDDLGLGPEYSRKSFIIYDRREFGQAYKRGQGYSGYLMQLAPIYVNPYMGTLISTE
jgi:hypothetical protein